MDNVPSNAVCGLGNFNVRETNAVKEILEYISFASRKVIKGVKAYVCHQPGYSTANNTDC